MKKNHLLLTLAALAGLFATDINAGSIDYLSNESAEWGRTFSRNASTDADAVHYNPAGTAFMADGIYFYACNMTVLKNYSSTLKATGTKYESDKASPIIPDVFAVYKKDNWAAMLGMGAVAGGGSVDYADGIPTFVGVGAGYGSAYTDGYLKATSFYPFVSLGGSYAFNEMLSVSLTARYVYGYKTVEGSATYTGGFLAGTHELDAKETAQGVGAMIGFDVRPVKELLVAIKLETPTILKFKTKINDGKDFGGKFYQDGKTRRKDLPAMANLGLSYQWNQLTVTSSLDTYFIGLSDQDKDIDGTLYTDGYDDDYDKIGWEASLSFEYAFMPNFLSASVGYMYDRIGGNEDTYNDFDYALDCQCFGGGVKVTPVQNLDLNLALSRLLYFSSDGSGGSMKYEKDAWMISAGVQYKI